MRQLRTCDFCGGDAAGTFEIVPPELDPTEAEQRRVVLCADCQPTLEELLEPLLARAGATDAEPDGTDGRGNAKRSDADRSADGAGGGTSTSDVRSDDGDDAARSASLEGGRTAGDEREAQGTPGPETERDEGSNAVITPDGPDRSTADDGVAIQPDGPDDGSKTESKRAAGVDADDGATSDATSTRPSRASRSNAAPKAYGKVLRLLQNREFPMARTDVEGLAAGAYDLEDHEVEAIVDHAVEQGDLVEDGRNVRLG